MALKTPVMMALITKNTVKVIIAGIKAAKDLETAGGTPSGIFDLPAAFCDAAIDFSCQKCCDHPDKHPFCARDDQETAHRRSFRQIQ